MRSGILAFGSLISTPGNEIDSKIVGRKSVITPFLVEFSRYSNQNRGGAPTLSPVIKGGSPVSAILLMLNEELSKKEIIDMLWRREVGKVGSGLPYPALKRPRAVRIKIIPNYEGMDLVIYTDFYASGKIHHPNARNLAKRAIRSVNRAPGNDGISYLLDIKKQGISTPLMYDYEVEICRQSSAESLEQALSILLNKK